MPLAPSDNTMLNIGRLAAMCVAATILSISGCYRSGGHPSDATSDSYLEDMILPDIHEDSSIDSPADSLNEPDLDSHEADVDAGDITFCPEDMVYIASSHTCIDRYEASRGPGGCAESVAHVMPWIDVSWHEAKEACLRAGKRLCEPDEWLDACRGPEDTDYPYGEAYIEGHCLIGLVDGPFEPQPTGSYHFCEGGYRLVFDMVGNVEEWVDVLEYREDAGDLAGTRGGAVLARSVPYDCTQAYLLAPVMDSEIVGFRCCQSP